MTRFPNTMGTALKTPKEASLRRRDLHKKRTLAQPNIPNDVPIVLVAVSTNTGPVQLAGLIAAMQGVASAEVVATVEAADVELGPGESLKLRVQTGYVIDGMPLPPGAG